MTAKYSTEVSVAAEEKIKVNDARWALAPPQKRRRALNCAQRRKPEEQACDMRSVYCAEVLTEIINRGEGEGIRTLTTCKTVLEFVTIFASFHLNLCRGYVPTIMAIILISNYKL